MDIREEIKKGPVLFDGGMGTYFAAREHRQGDGCEPASIDSPLLISAIHREYLEAGARAIKTNTFASNRVNYTEEMAGRIIHASWNLASKAAEKFDAAVFADIGPVTGLSPKATAEEYAWIVDKFLDCGAENFLFETQQDEDGLAEAAARIRERVPGAYIIASFAVTPDGFTRSGLYAEDALRDLNGSGLFDAVGLNCMIGVRQMSQVLESIDTDGMTLSIMPNSGFPTVVDNRTYFDSDPVYFGRGLAEMAQKGVKFLGGCCGTTPRHIAEAAAAFAEISSSISVGASARSAAVSAGADSGEEAPRESRFWEKLTAGEKPFAVELDPPDHGGFRKYLEGAAKLEAAGADIITIADCPGARARMDSSLLASRVQSDVGIEAIPHITCRDRNLNASKALLLGLSASGVRNVLIVTGDPFSSAQRDEAKSVYEFNSRRMASFVRTLGEKSLLAPFHIFGALNVNARNFASQIGIAKKKLEMGMVGFLTQPVLSAEAAENMKIARRELPDAYILGGVLPPVSERNAVFMENEMAGIHVASPIIRAYHDLSKEEAQKLALDISLRAAEEIRDQVDGFYLMTPFMRTGLMTDLMEGIREGRAEGTLTDWIQKREEEA